MKYIKILILSVFLFSGIHVIAQNPKNIILMIGDGMGFNHIEASDNYYGENQKFKKWDAYRVSTYYRESFYNADSAANDYTYVLNGFTDSGAAATALATGYKTHKGVIGLNGNYYKVKNITEYAEENGLSSGVVSSVPFCHATPAGFIAHVTNRNFYHDIAVQMLTKSKADVIIACGNPLFDNNGKKRDTADYKYIPKFLYENITSGLTSFKDGSGNEYEILSADSDNIPDKWTFVSSVNDLEEISSGNNIPERLFSMPEVFSTLQYERSNTEYTKNLPDLSVMSTAALNVLNQNKKGFFLMIEGGAIDWASHDSSFIGAVEETYDFNKAVKAVVNWIEENSSWDETLVIITADHETGYLTDASFDDKMKDDMSCSYSFETTVPKNTKNSIEGLRFLSSGDKYSKCQHSNQLVPLFVKGKYADLFKQRISEYRNDNLNHDIISDSWYIDNTDIAKIIIKIIQGD